jgi:hypothetical protein
MTTHVRVTTNFDCTVTGVTGHYKSARIPFLDQSGKTINNVDDWNRARNQQRNWETLMQIVGLYTQPYNLTLPVYDQLLKSWSFEFSVEFDGVFDTDGDSLGLLKKSCAGVPMMLGLGEKANTSEFLDPEVNIVFQDFDHK